MIALTNSQQTEGLYALVRKIKPQRANEFLLDLLNLNPSNQTRVNVFWRRFADFLPESPATHRDQIWLDWRQRQLRFAWTQATVIERELAVLAIIPETLSYELAESIRKIAPDLDMTPESPGRRWTFKVVNPDLLQPDLLQPNLAKIREHVEELREKADIPGVWIYRESPAFVLGLLRALHLADRMRRCLNANCLNPYFIAADRRQKYCSEVCALPAQREFKRTWWDTHGAEWQRKRRAKAKRRKRR